MNNAIIKADYQTLIYEFHGYKVMLDFNLAALYSVETKRLRDCLKISLRQIQFLIKLFSFTVLSFASTKRKYQRKVTAV